MMPLRSYAKALDGRGPAAALLLIAVLALALLLPAWFNGVPILYPDTIGYFNAGAGSVSRLLGSATPGDAHAVQRQVANGVGTERSIFYGLPFALIGNVTAVAVLQAGAAAGLLGLAMAELGLPWRWRLGLGLAIATAGGLGVFTSTIMPDWFSGFGIVALALLVSGRRNLVWPAVILAACLMHKSNAAALTLVLAGLLAFYRRCDRGGLVMAAGMVALAWTGHALVEVAVRQVTGKASVSRPFLLGRVIGDGTAALYLRSACPGARLEICRLVSHLPMTENEFLWGPHGFRTLSPEQRRRVIEETPIILKNTLLQQPGLQLVRSAENFGRQLLTVGAREYSVHTNLDPAATPRLRAPLAAYPQTLIGRGQGEALLGPYSAVMLAAYLLGLLAWLGLRRGPLTGWELALVGGLVANAACCGVLAGVFDRYQGRVAWVAVLLGGWTLFRLVQRGAQTPGQAGAWA